MLRPVGRKCPQGTATLRVTPTVFIRRRHGAFSCFAAHGTVPHGRARPAPFATCGFLLSALVSTLRVPCVFGFASPTRNVTRLYFSQGSLFHNSTLRRATSRCFALDYPHRNVAALQRAGLLRQKTLWCFWLGSRRYRPARFYRARHSRGLFKALAFLSTTLPALATLGERAPGCRSVAVVCGSYVVGVCNVSASFADKVVCRL